MPTLWNTAPSIILVVLSETLENRKIFYKALDYRLTRLTDFGLSQ